MSETPQTRKRYLGKQRPDGLWVIYDPETGRVVAVQPPGCATAYRCRCDQEPCVCPAAVREAGR